MSKPLAITSEPQRALAELSAYYAQIPEDLLASGKPSAVVVYGILDRIAHEGTGWTSIEAIAQRTNLSTRTVQSARAWLIATGWVTLLHQGRSGRASEYLLPWRSNHHAKIAQSAEIASSTCKIDMLQDAQIAHYPEPLTEPKIIEPRDTERKRDFSESEVPPQNQELWPEWYAIGFSVPGWKVSLETAEAWRVKEGISVELAKLKSYALRDWWSRLPTKGKRKTQGNPYYTWQHWCQRDKTVEQGDTYGKFGPDTSPYHAAATEQKRRREAARTAGSPTMP